LPAYGWRPDSVGAVTVGRSGVEHWRGSLRAPADRRDGTLVAFPTSADASNNAAQTTATALIPLIHAPAISAPEGEPWSVEQVTDAAPEPTPEYGSDDWTLPTAPIVTAARWPDAVLPPDLAPVAVTGSVHGEVLERLGRVETLVAALQDDLDEDEPDADELFDRLVGTSVLDRLIERLYPVLRGRLRGELLIERERRGALTDLR
jgi:hypothetical protein